MIQAARYLFSSKPIWVRSLVLKQGLVRWPLKIAMPSKGLKIAIQQSATKACRGYWMAFSIFTTLVSPGSWLNSPGHLRPAKNQNRPRSPA